MDEKIPLFRKSLGVGGHDQTELTGGRNSGTKGRLMNFVLFKKAKY